MRGGAHAGVIAMTTASKHPDIKSHTMALTGKPALISQGACSQKKPEGTYSYVRQPIIPLKMELPNGLITRVHWIL